jgi:hypothetical protein
MSSFWREFKNVVNACRLFGWTGNIIYWGQSRPGASFDLVGGGPIVFRGWVTNDNEARP